MKATRPLVLSLALGLFYSSITYAANLPVSADTYTSNHERPQTHGSQSDLNISIHESSYLKFDLSSLPADLTNSQIRQAVLRVYVNSINGSGTVSVAQVTSPWSEDTLTYSASPSIGSTQATFVPQGALSFVSIDLTTLVKAWVGSPGTNFGVVLKTTSTTLQVTLESKESSLSSHEAVLDITLENTGAMGPQGPVGATGAQGPIGATGPQGLVGATGPQGPQGLVGATGPQGPVGATGAQGLVGATGPQGLVGAAGPQGPVGDTGAQGPIGVTGPQGLVGATGPQGPAGTAGLVVPDLVLFIGAYDSGTGYLKNDLVSSSTTNIYYYSLVDNNTNNTPESSPTYWAGVALNQLHSIRKSMTLSAPGFTSLVSVNLTGIEVGAGRIAYQILANDGGSQIATEEGVMQYCATANSITSTVQTTDKLHLGTVNSGSTPGFFNPGSHPGVSVFDNVTFSSPAPIVIHEVTFQILNTSGSQLRLEP